MGSYEKEEFEQDFYFPGQSECEEELVFAEILESK